jgi:hypothetical protein
MPELAGCLLQDLIDKSFLSAFWYTRTYNREEHNLVEDVRLLLIIPTNRRAPA